MNDDGSTHEKSALLFRILAIVAATLVLVIVAGTVFGLVSGSRGKAVGRLAALEGGANPELAIYDEIGMVRANTADEKPSIVVASLSFPYDPSDREFREELFDKLDSIKAACVKYFSAKTADELHPAFLGQVRAQLRDVLNGELVMGKVETVYLGEFTVLK